MFNDNIDGAIIMAGIGPCANNGSICQNETIPVNYTMTGVNDKPMFFYSGAKDPVVLHEWALGSADYFELQGANVKRRWVRDFLHVLPNSVTSNFKYNPPLSCGKRLDDSPYSGVHNCGWNMALEGLSHILNDDYLIKAKNYQD